MINKVKNTIICKICNIKNINILLIPCSHLICCTDCYDKLQDVKCPVCKNDIVNTMKIYIIVY
jgi:E3 ubiquitin-protein ligase BOI-like protein